MSSSPAPSSLDHEMSPVPINAVLTESSFYPVGLIKPSGEATVKVHPLDELTPDEIIMIGAAVKSHITWYRREIKALKFMSAGVVPPPKRDVLAFLHIPVEPGKPAETPPEYLLRRAETDFIDPLTGFGYNAILSFSREKHIWKVDAIKQLPEGVHPQLTVEELLQMDELVRHDPTILELAAKVGVEPDQLCADGWSVGCDERWPNSMRLQQCIMYARFVPDSNLYAHPLDFLPVVDVNSKKVLHVDFPPMRTSEGLTSPTTAGPPLSSDPLKASGRERHAPPRGRCEYLPDLMDESMKPRRRPEPLKPLHISQPEGVSFKFTDGNTLEWQNWTMHVAFSAREGIALSTITWNDDGRIRPIFYRLSTAEMVVPYAAPEHPHPRKCAFDVGEYGLGTQANELSLGCDCLGTIHYLPGAWINHDGTPSTLKRAICIHEEDDGLLWKHTDYRLGGRMHAVRSRRLVISMVCTLANYEYRFAYHFYLDGTVEFEVRLTGIVNTYLLGEGEVAAPYGTQVSPGINAQHHQHIFSLRVDPMIDGLNNTVVQTDIVPVPALSGSVDNYSGNAFVANDVRITRSTEGALDFDGEKDRRWKIVNPSKRHYSSGQEAGYGIKAKGAWELLKCAEGSRTRKRAAFAEHHLWVVKDVEGPDGPERRYPAGKYVPQTRENPADSVRSWVDGPEESLENTDLVMFLSVGVTHITRPEDWPIMPAEHLKVAFKPIGFFDRNPSLHVVAEEDKCSRLAFGHANDGEKAVNGHEQGRCCP